MKGARRVAVAEGRRPGEVQDPVPCRAAVEVKEGTKELMEEDSEKMERARRVAVAAGRRLGEVQGPVPCRGCGGGEGGGEGADGGVLGEGSRRGAVDG